MGILIKRLIFGAILVAILLKLLPYIGWELDPTHECKEELIAGAEFFEAGDSQRFVQATLKTEKGRAKYEACLRKNGISEKE